MKIFIMLSLVLLLAACKDQVDPITTVEGYQLELNDGAKWKVDPNMLSIIKNMESAITDFKGVDVDTHHQLGTTLNDHLAKLIDACNMKGAAHDALHQWLVPYMSMANSLSEAKDNTEVKELYSNLKTSFVTFNTYFQ